MKFLIKKILKEEFDDFSWIKDIEPTTDLTPSQLYNRYDKIPIEFSGKFISNQLRDIYYEGGKFILRVSDWGDLSDLFEDTESRYGRVGRDLAKLILDEGDYWEPYYDIVNDWVGDVWSLVMEDDEIIQYIKQYIEKDGLLGKPLENDYDIEGDVLTKEMMEDVDVLGEIIDNEDLLDDLKRELRWAYESAYNVAARDEIYNSVMGSIKDLLGDGSWEDYRGKTLLQFEVTSLVINTITELIDRCFTECRRWYDKDKHYDPDEFNSEYEAFESFCENCIDYPFNEWGDFVGIYAEYLNETNDLLNPRYDEWPDNNKLLEYFKEDIYSRF